jgi:hypothetical protein
MTESIRHSIGQNKEVQKLKENLKRSDSQFVQALLGLLNLLFPSKQ